MVLTPYYERLIEQPRKIFLILLLGICGLYLIIQSFFIPYARLTIDDLWLAYHTYQYQTALPYRDFLPYKTVLGYYVFLIPLTLFHGVIKPLIGAKLFMACVNTCFLGGVCVWLKKFFDQRAVLISVVLIVFTQLFLVYSVEIRVDLLAYWIGLIATLFCFEKKYLLAGITLGLSFVICQKAVWYVLAINAGLMAEWVVNKRDRQSIKEIFLLNMPIILILLGYILFWAYFSSVSTVLRSVFYEPYLLTIEDWYQPLFVSYWHFTINTNPGLILLWPIAFFALVLTSFRQRVFIISYSAVLLFSVITSKHPFNYSPLIAVPAILLLYSAFFSWLYNESSAWFPGFFQKLLTIIFTLIYCLISLFLQKKYGLLAGYQIVCLIPILLCVLVLIDRTHIAAQTAHFVVRPFLAYLVFMVGFAFSFYQFLGGLPEENGHYQKSMLRLVDQLLRDGGSYVAGVPFLRNATQPVPGLVHLVGPAIDYIARPTKKLRVNLLSSMYLSPVSARQIIQSIDNTPVKFYVDNNRFHYLPLIIHDYLATQYQHFWGSIFLYAPQIKAGSQRVLIKFPGQYQVVSAENTKIFLNGRLIGANSTISLLDGYYESNSSATYRLKLIPELKKELLDVRDRKNQWWAVLT